MGKLSTVHAWLYRKISSLQVQAKFVKEEKLTTEHAQAAHYCARYASSGK
jgi:hypothetical protein